MFDTLNIRFATFQKVKANGSKALVNKEADVTFLRSSLDLWCAFLSGEVMTITNVLSCLKYWWCICQYGL